MGKKEIDKEILRLAIVAELDAVSLYEQMAAVTADAGVRKVLFDAAREEKTHVGEFQALLLSIDPEQNKELRKGEGEVEAILKGK